MLELVIPLVLIASWVVILLFFRAVSEADTYEPPPLPIENWNWPAR